MSRTVTYTITNAANGVRFAPCELVQRGAQASEPAELIDIGTRNPYLEADSQEFKAGDMVYLNAGAVTQRLTGDNGPICGFALTDATNVTSGNAAIRIMPVVTGNVYAMNACTASSPTTATNLVDVKTYIGNCYDLAQATVTETDGSTTYCTVVNLDAQTDARVVVVGVQKTVDLTSSSFYLRLLVKFLPYGMVSGDPTYQGLQFDA